MVVVGARITAVTAILGRSSLTGPQGVIGTTQVVETTAGLTPLFWLIACVAIIVS